MNLQTLCLSLVKRGTMIKTLLVMKFTVLFFLAICLQAGAVGYSQTVTMSLKNAPLQKVFMEINRQTGFQFFYKDELLDKAGHVDITVKETPLRQVLDICFAKLPISYAIVENTIVIKQKLPQPEPVVIPFLEIKGKVLNEKGEPMAGVSVLNKRNGKGTSTNTEGNFTISAEKGDVLEISYVGYKKQSVKLSDDVNISVQMQVEIAEMSDIVVVGYGEIAKKDVTGAVSSIISTEVNKVVVTNFEAALVGRAPGVHVVKSSGAPGAIATIRIRGGTSAIGSNEPLYVIDGIPVETGDGFGNDAYSNDSRNKLSPLAAINPADIARIDILKDASSAAIYGSRAANGVVIVTTKRGQKGDKPNITLDYKRSSDQFVNTFQMLNAAQYHSVVRTAYQNVGAALPVNLIAYPDANTDWVSQITRKAPTDNMNVSINGGTPSGNTLYSFSGSLTKQLGVIDHTDYKRQTLRASMTTLLLNKLRFGTNINLAFNENNGSATSQYYVLSQYRPDVPIIDARGNYGASPDSVQSNPVARLRQPAIMKNQSVMASFFGEMEIIKGLWLRSSIAATVNKGSNERYTPSTDVFEIRNGRKGSRTDYTNTSNSRIFENTLSYVRRFNANNVNLVGGASYTQTKNNFTSINSTNFQDDNVLNNLGSAGSIQTYTSGGGISGLSSYFLRTNYNFDSRYYITFTGRADHSTKFGPNNRWGYFPSGALAWRISRERFMDVAPFVQDLHLRVSYGKTGSANFSDFQYATFFGSGSFYFGNNGAIANTVPNPDIRWETTYQFDAALEYNLFSNKLRGSIGYFEKKTKDMILNRQIIRETGGTTQYANMGDFLNKGWEIELGSDVVNQKNFAYYTDLNLTRYRGKVLKLNGGSYLNLREGESIGYFTGYRVAGIFQSQQEIDALNAKSPTKIYQSASTKPGDFMFVDINGDGQVNTADISVIGRSEPDFYGGWNNIVRYKNLELTAFFNFTIGNSLYNSGTRNLIFFSTNTSNYSTRILDTWSADNTSAKLPRLAFNDPNRNSRDSDFFIEKASFFKLKNVELAYTLRNNNLLKKILLTNVRAYTSLSNVFVITKYSGIDPEVNSNPAGNFSQGVDNNVYPVTRTFTVGLTANF